MVGRIPRWFTAEVLGTFLLVFFGIGSVATAVALGVNAGLFQIAAVWGIGVALAITLTAHHSGAHLNPAITLAFAAWTDFPKARLPGYLLAQFIGAFLAAAVVHQLFGEAISVFEEKTGIARGGAGSEASAMIFGEFFPNPGGVPLTESARATVPFRAAFLAEFLGTLLLALAVFGFTAKSNSARPKRFTPLAIGLTLSALICIFAPLSMGGFNPARDLAPRLYSSLVGWGSVPFQANGHGWFTVYILAPCLGGLLGGYLGRCLFPERD